MISFRANFINNTTVKCNNKDLKVSFVELDSENQNDLKVIDIVDKSWNNGQSYAWEINDCFKNSYRDSIRKFYALTSQNSNYDKLQPYEVLGLAQVFKREELNGKAAENLYEIEYLQADPEYTCDNLNSPIKGIGTAIINSIKFVFKNKELIVNPVNSKRFFYELNGFKDFGPRFMRFKP